MHTTAPNAHEAKAQCTRASAGPVRPRAKEQNCTLGEFTLKISKFFVEIHFHLRIIDAKELRSLRDRLDSGFPAK